VSGRRYRVAHLITRLELGGAQQNTLFCTAHHDRSRFDVELLAGRGGILDDEARRITDARVELWPELRHPIAPLSDVRALLRLRRHLRERRVDLVHTHSSKAGILGRAAAFLAGVPAVVHTAHGWSFNDTQPRTLRALYLGLERAAARVTDRLVVVARRHRDEGLAAGIGRPDQYLVVRSGIDFEAYRHPRVAREEVRRALGFAAGHTVVGTIACMKPQKAPLDFVRAAAAAAAADGTLRFFIAGDGMLRADVERLVAELGLQDRLRVLGWRRDVVDLLHACDIFLLTSLFEGLPRVVLQAAAAGVPVVATAVDGTPEVVRHETTGLLVPPARPAEAASEVLRLAGDAPLRRRLASAAAAALDESFDIHAMVRRLDELYLELLSQKVA